HDRSQTLDNADYLKYQILQKIFSASGMVNIIRESNLNFSAAKGDFFTLSFINQFFKLKGFQDYFVVDGISSDSLRTLELAEHNKDKYSPKLPSLDVVQTGVLDLIDLVTSHDIRHRDAMPTRLHYELAVLLSDSQVQVEDLTTCMSLF
ncbi:MAG: hypothetical protein KDD37_05020, partial [Bdellovibrionales bacterium]|nr:hypothetical protein [Bdellovibrionales bacterium]